MGEVQWGSTRGRGPFEVFDELHKTPLCPQKRKQGHVVEVRDGGLLGFVAFKDLQVSLEEDAGRSSFEDLWVVPKRATRDADINGVGLEDEEEDTTNEDLDQPGEVANSSSRDLHNPPAVPSTSSNPASQLVFVDVVDEAVLQAMERGKMHEWTNVEFNAICWNQGLSVRGAKGELMERVKVHFQRLYRLYQL